MPASISQQISHQMPTSQTAQSSVISTQYIPHQSQTLTAPTIRIKADSVYKPDYPRESGGFDSASFYNGVPSGVGGARPATDSGSLVSVPGGGHIMPTLDGLVIQQVKDNSSLRVDPRDYTGYNGVVTLVDCKNSRIQLVGQVIKLSLGR